MGPEPAKDYARSPCSVGHAVRGWRLHSFAITAGTRYNYGSYRRSLPSIRANRVGEEDRDHVYAPTAYTGDDGANRSSRANLQTGAILHLPRERRDRNPGYVRWNRQADPRMLDAHQAIPTGALRPTESRALSQDPNGKGRDNLGPPVWMQYVSPPPGTPRQTSYRTPPGLASHHRGAAREARPPDDLVQPCPRDNPVREHWDNVAHEKTFKGGDAHPNEQPAKTNHVRKPWGRSAERTGWEGERVDRLCTERHPGVWHNGGWKAMALKAVVLV